MDKRGTEIRTAREDHNKKKIGLLIMLGSMNNKIVELTVGLHLVALKERNAYLKYISSSAACFFPMAPPASLMDPPPPPPFPAPLPSSPS